MPKWDFVINVTVESNTHLHAENAVYSELSKIEGVISETAEIVECEESEE